jgi:2-amino-4-hydroxy-6-hydroxymethyldihydropteridine diphosphokinase
VTVAFIALGSNLGDRLLQLQRALDELARDPGTRILSVSHAYESQPWGVADQPAFANAVTSIDFRGEADVLLSVLKDIEERMGREPSRRFGPRIIDLDILLFGDEEWVSRDLTIPHPRMLERDFVVTPLLEIAPAAALPDGSAVTCEGARHGRVIADLGPIPGWDLAPFAADAGPAEWQPAGPTAAAVSEPAPDYLVDEYRPRPAAAKEDGAPFEVGDWVAVGPGRVEMSGNDPSDFDLFMYESFLLQAGIPVRFYPHRPNEATVVWPEIGGVSVRLMVPRGRVEEARRMVNELGTRGDS